MSLVSLGPRANPPRCHVRHPPRVDAVDEDLLLAQRCRAGASEHIECSFRHIGVGMTRALLPDRELACQRRDVYFRAILGYFRAILGLF